MASELIAGCLAKIGEFMVEISGRQLGYLIHYNRNINNLKEQVEKLEAIRGGVQQSIDAAENNGERILPEVDLWLVNVGKIMGEAQSFLNDVNANKKCLCGWFPDLKSRRRLSSQATKKEKTVTQLIEDGKFDRISNPAPPTVTEFMCSSGDFVAFDSTKSVMEKAMLALKEDKINFIGLYGMGGVGKTTLAKVIAKKAKDDCIFDKVVMVVVSQNVDMKKIQDRIADTLGLNLNDQQSDEGRASRLHAVLKNVKRLLVIFDDVWERLDVKAVGVPFGVEHEGCKIMITSRRKQVCNGMGTGDQTTKIIRLDTLAPSESWDLFRNSVGSGVVDDYPIKNEADKVVSECRGLPIALVTVGRAMRDKDLEGWKQAVRDLKKSIPENLEGVEKDVFRCLKLSYDYLRSEESKSCFLLCSLFPEDHNIKIESLMRYGWGLGIFKNNDTIREARGTAYLIFNNLKESCLLLEGHNKDFVKMHDVVRDVAISIGSGVYFEAGVQKDGKFDSISNPAPPRVLEFLSSSGDFVAFNSTKLVMEEAMEALKEDKINFIGLYGMGGVGKTTLVNEIVKKVREDRIFNKVVMVVISQTVDLKKIQGQIAETLGSNLNELNTDAGRASRLYAVFKDVKRLLVIFDDVWERLDVKAVGVPLGVQHNEGCKIMITSRHKQVCNVMGTGDQTTKIIHLDTLSPSESWDLFRSSVGSSVVDDYPIKDEADKVVRECKGLPIALVTVGRAMKGKDLEGWKQAVRDLEKSIPENLEGVDKEVFSCLKLSYDYLRSEESKSCFLLCSLFPENHDIKIETLMRYGWGLGIFKNVDTIQKARCSAHSIINNLKASCLLFKGRDKDFVKMHDVVRDVAISIVCCWG